MINFAGEQVMGCWKSALLEANSMVYFRLWLRRRMKGLCYCRCTWCIGTLHTVYIVNNCMGNTHHTCHTAKFSIILAKFYPLYLYYCSLTNVVLLSIVLCQDWTDSLVLGKAINKQMNISELLLSVIKYCCTIWMFVASLPRPWKNHQNSRQMMSMQTFLVCGYILNYFFCDCLNTYHTPRFEEHWSGLGRRRTLHFW